MIDKKLERAWGSEREKGKILGVVEGMKRHKKYSSYFQQDQQGQALE